MTLHDVFYRPGALEIGNTLSGGVENAITPDNPGRRNSDGGQPSQDERAYVEAAMQPPSGSSAPPAQNIPSDAAECPNCGRKLIDCCGNCIFDDLPNRGFSDILPDAEESLAEYHRELNRIQDAHDAEDAFWREQEVAQQEADDR